MTVKFRPLIWLFILGLVWAQPTLAASNDSAIIETIKDTKPQSIKAFLGQFKTVLESRGTSVKMNAESIERMAKNPDEALNFIYMMSLTYVGMGYIEDLQEIDNIIDSAFKLNINFDTPFMEKLKFSTRDFTEKMEKNLNINESQYYNSDKALMDMDLVKNELAEIANSLCLQTSLYKAFRQEVRQLRVYYKANNVGDIQSPTKHVLSYLCVALN